jgi:hypothetical protein
VSDLFKEALSHCFKDKNDKRTLLLKSENIFAEIFYNENKEEVFFIECDEWCKSKNFFIVSENKEGFQCKHCRTFYTFCEKAMRIKRWELPVL